MQSPQSDSTPWTLTLKKGHCTSNLLDEVKKQQTTVFFIRRLPRLCFPEEFRIETVSDCAAVIKLCKIFKIRNQI